MTAERRAVLFDLDGTLIDTAPDMVRILQDMLATHGEPPLPYDLVRSVVSNGSLGLVRLAFPDAPEARLRDLQAEYLELYGADVCRESHLFPGMDSLLTALEENARPWGVVTNKPERMTTPLMSALNLMDRAACVVSGDTLPQRKPDPTPLLFASQHAGFEPAEAVYVGDALRDIEAGRAAGMLTIGVQYGYIVDGDSAHDWAADHVAADIGELTTIIQKAVNLPV